MREYGSIPVTSGARTTHTAGIRPRIRLRPDLALQEDKHAVGGAALAKDDLAGRIPHLGHLRGQPFQTIRRQVGEYRHSA